MSRSGHNFADAMATELLWHVRNAAMIELTEQKIGEKIILLRFQLCAHKQFVKQLPGPSLKVRIGLHSATVVYLYLVSKVCNMIIVISKFSKFLFRKLFLKFYFKATQSV